MERLIYYPGFEVQRVDWLKFALLYIGKLNPIIPEAGEIYLSDTFKKIQAETNLFQLHRPEYQEGEMATLDAIEVTNKIIRDPRSYSRIFRNDNILDIWRNPDFHNYTLFADKYTQTWEDFCFENGIATQHDEGILLNDQLGYVYMTLLAQIIADRRGVSPITDHSNLDRLAIFARRVETTAKDRLQTAQAQINLKLPRNLSDISFDELIRVRNRPGFKEKLSAFQHEFNNYLSNIEMGTENTEFVVNFGDIWQEFSGDIAKIGIGTISFALGTWLAVTNPQISTEEYLKTVIVGGAGLVVSSVIDVKKSWEKSRSKRFTRKYLADIRNI